MAIANGFIHQCNLSKKLMRKIAKYCPVIIGTGKSGHNRNIRHIVLNIAELTSDAILEELRIELQKELKRRGITASVVLSNAEWVVAAPNNRAIKGGVKHRDVKNKQPGYLTVILFLSVADFVLKSAPFLSFVRLRSAPLALRSAPFACSKMPLFIFYLLAE